MKVEKDNNIAIFDTFKTRKNSFTGEAKRQRGIIAHLATEQSPELVEKLQLPMQLQGKIIYYGKISIQESSEILDEVLIPSGIVKVEGRLPLRRGPRELCN